MKMTKQAHKATRQFLLLLLVLSGCDAYDKVGPLAYDHANSLYTVCNQKKTEQLDRIAERIAKARENGDLSAQETEWLKAIIEDARSGEWKVAAGKCRELMEAQVEH